MTPASDKAREALRRHVDFAEDFGAWLEGSVSAKTVLIAKLVSFEASIRAEYEKPSDAAGLTARIEELEKERDEARSIVHDIHWMAQRYADGRKSYAPGHFNDAISKALPWLPNIEPARDGMLPEYRSIEERALAAEQQLAEAVQDAFRDGFRACVARPLVTMDDDPKAEDDAFVEWSAARAFLSSIKDADHDRS